MKTILVPTDFSEASVNAAIYATKLARDLGANMTILHVNVPEESFNQSPFILKTEKDIDSAESQLDALRDMMHTYSGESMLITTELMTGEIFSQIYELCLQMNPYLVIMGSQGSTAAERFLLGSNSIHAMRNLSWPLLTIPPGCIYTEIKKIALASDFSGDLQTSLETINRLRTDFNASLEVIHIGHNKEEDYAQSKSEVMETLLKSGNVEYDFITQVKPEEGILEYTESNQIDMLFVIPKQYGFFEQLFHKSISKQLVLRSKVPVMALNQ